jgi:hypothetical protein
VFLLRVHINIDRGDNKMGERSIKHNEVKKKKKADVNDPAPSLSQRPIVTQPELIKKKKKPQ